MTNTNTNKDEKETMRRMNDSADLHNKIMTKEEIRKSKCKTCGADTYIGLDGKEIHGKYLGKPKEIKEPIKEFDIMASKLGLDGEQMDELRDVLRKALKAKNQEHKRYLEILQEEIAIGIMEAKEKVKQDLLKKIEVAENQFKDGYYVFHFTYTSNTGKRIAEINKVNEPLPPDMAYQLAKKHISEFPESVMDWFVENRGVIHILKDINQLLK